MVDDPFYHSSASSSIVHLLWNFSLHGSHNIRSSNVLLHKSINFFVLYIILLKLIIKTTTVQWPHSIDQHMRCAAEKWPGNRARYVPVNVNRIRGTIRNSVSGKVRT